MFDIEEINEAYRNLQAKKTVIEKNLKRESFALTINQKKLRDYEEARTILTTIAKEVQQNAIDHLEDIVTLAIQTVFERPYVYKLNFEERRNTISCAPTIKDGSKERSPKDHGGGMRDIIGFINKIVIWSIQFPKARNTIIFDEPFRFCGALTLLAAEMVKKLSAKLGFQVIIITHEKALAEICDRVYEVTKPKHSSRVRRIK